MTSPFEGRALTRRQLLASFGLAGAALAAGSPAAAAVSRGGKADRLVAAAASTRAAGSDLGAVEHIVFLMMENRSYDHYFGAYPKGRGFSDHPARSLGVFAQDYPGGAALSPPNVLLPFHLSAGGGYECTDDLTHDSGPAALVLERREDGQLRQGAHLVDLRGRQRRHDDGVLRPIRPPVLLCPRRCLHALRRLPLPRSSGPPTPIDSWRTAARSTPPAPRADR